MTVIFDQTAMLIDKQYVIVGNNAVYVPYLPEHVEKYHQWMTSMDLLSQTASEPLSLEEEFEMQVTWSQDADKRTFIVLSVKELIAAIKSNISASLYSFLSFKFDASLLRMHRSSSAYPGACLCGVSTDYEYEGLYLCASCLVGHCLSSNGLIAAVGDVNLFLHHYLQDDEEDSRFSSLRAAEIEVMIAEPSARGQHLGREAVERIMHHGQSELGIMRYVVKISNDNIPSLALFKKLRFTQFASVECFNEAHLHLINEDVDLNLIAAQEDHDNKECVLYIPGEPQQVLTSKSYDSTSGTLITSDKRWGDLVLNSDNSDLIAKLHQFEQERTEYYDTLNGITKTLHLIQSLEGESKSHILSTPFPALVSTYTSGYPHMTLLKQDTTDKKVTMFQKKQQMSVNKFNNQLQSDINQILQILNKTENY